MRLPRPGQRFAAPQGAPPEWSDLRSSAWRAAKQAPPRGPQGETPSHTRSRYLQLNMIGSVA
eukprot:6216271-Pyramimonas_sp.AAC.1